jgi:hypothetical protein
MKRPGPPFDFRLLLAIVAALVTLLASACSTQTLPAPSTRPQPAIPPALGPFPLKATVYDGPYKLALTDYQVLPTDAARVYERRMVNPPVSRTPARPGYRYVDATILVESPTDTSTAKLADSIETATVIAGGERIPLLGRAMRVTYNPRSYPVQMEFEIPMTAHDAILYTRSRGSSETLSFRLW